MQLNDQVKIASFAAEVTLATLAGNANPLLAHHPWSFWTAWALAAGVDASRRERKSGAAPG